jgi:cation/acetate symporter
VAGPPALSSASSRSPPASWPATRTWRSWWLWAFAVAASANLPTILYSLFWKRFNTTGALWSINGGLGSCVLADRASPGAVSGRPGAIRAAWTSDVFPLANPGLVSIPLSFLLGVVGTLVGGRDRGEHRRHAEMEVRALTGAGAERPTAAPPRHVR